MSCPACDAEGLKVTEALALGICLGVALKDMHEVTKMMCGKHRVKYVVAMAAVADMLSTGGPR